MGSPKAVRRPSAQLPNCAPRAAKKRVNKRLDGRANIEYASPVEYASPGNDAARPCKAQARAEKRAVEAAGKAGFQRALRAGGVALPGARLRWRKLMRPLLRSYGESSSVTRSPARMRMWFFFILPAE